MAVTRSQTSNRGASIDNPQKKKKKKAQETKPKPKPKATSGRRFNKKNGKIVCNGRQAIPTQPYAGLPKRRFPPVDSPISKGLFNTRNDCYKLATLQVLFHTPAFYRYLGKIHRNCALQLKECVTCALQDLLYQYWQQDDNETRRARLNTFHASTKAEKNLPEDLDDLRDDLLGDRQGDAYDFLLYLVNQQISSKTRGSDPASFRSIFQMGFETTRTCLTCRHESAAEFEQPSFILELPVNNPTGARSRSLHDCLGDFLGDGTQTYTCDQKDCSGTQRRTATLLTHASEILVMKLAISTNPGIGQVNTKIFATHTEIVYPEILNLNQYVDHNQVSEDCVYRLDGVIAHSGPETSGGHYVAMVRQYNSQRDFAFINDDSVTTDLNWGTMLRPTIGGRRIESYILVYTKM
ncbi:hypothetical protein AC578_3040 [Pseudocercospora eumusae]|uniref:USP domain-containing protein n=1 Tax=Pseudocercospora eumusae TaxID=321146 RepID=A0A139H9R2_9PEZI|nr:hypothetical protein AC578_3040 [Pseudocercospora eumusae]